MQNTNYASRETLHELRFANKWLQAGMMMAVAAVYFIAARLSLSLAFGNTNASSVWPPSGIAFAVILLWGYRTAPAVFLGALAANVLFLTDLGLAAGSLWAASFATALGNMLEGLLGAWCIRRFVKKRMPFNALQDLFVFIIAAGLICPMISASFGTASFSAAAGHWSASAQMWLTWWLGDAAGILIVSPLIIMLKMRRWPTLSRGRWIEAGIAFCILAAAAALIFGYDYRLEYALLPPLVWIAVRFGRLVSAAAILLVSSLAVASAAGHAVVLADPKTSQSLLYLQTYIGVISIITLCLSVLMHHRQAAEHHLKTYQEHLEDIVRNRNAELLDANSKLVCQIEEIDRGKAALGQSEKQYRDLVQSVNSIILRWKPDGSVTFFNTYAQEFFGFTEAEMLGRNLVGSIVPVLESSGRDLAWLIEDIIHHPEGHAFNENENIRKDGGRVWIAWTNKPIFDEAGRLCEILSVGNDITKRKSMEESLRQTLEELSAAKERAEEADRIKSAFLAAMSHELRTPLNSIIGFTGIMLQEFAGPLNDEQKKQLGMVQGSSRHLLSLINDVLDISKIEAGQLHIGAEPFSVRAAIEKTAASLRQAAIKKGLVLTVHIAGDVGEAIGDSRRFEQILLNLLSNAVKFTERGEVTLTATVIPDARPSGANERPPVPAVQIRVTDTGIGIRSEDFEKLFQPFRQLDAGIARKNEGTGLGLAICRRLADLMSGDIRAESVWGKGSTFTLILPLKPMAAP